LLFQGRGRAAACEVPRPRKVYSLSFGGLVWVGAGVTLVASIKSGRSRCVLVARNDDSRCRRMRGGTFGRRTTAVLGKAGVGLQPDYSREVFRLGPRPLEFVPLWGNLASCAPVANPPPVNNRPHMKATSSLGQRPRALSVPVPSGTITGPDPISQYLFP
jgi:hypothetical protein